MQYNSHEFPFFKLWNKTYGKFVIPVEIFWSADSNQAVNIGKFCKNTDFIIIFKLNANCHDADIVEVKELVTKSLVLHTRGEWRTMLINQ